MPWRKSILFAFAEVFLAAVVILTPIVEFIEKYIFRDWEFVISLAVLMSIDTVLGAAAAMKRRKFGNEGFAKIFKKTIAYGVFLIVIHVAIHMKAEGEPITILAWLDSAGYSAIVVREIISIIEKLDILYPDLLPSWIRRRLEIYDRTGKIEEDPLL